MGECRRRRRGGSGMRLAIKIGTIIVGAACLAGAAQRVGGSPAQSGEGKGAEYVGSNKCRPCHL